MTDTPETLAAALLAAAARAVGETRAVVGKGAQNVKNEAKANALRSAPTRNARAPYAISYGMKLAPTAIEADIGYDKDKPGGALGNLLEYGSRNNPPHRDLGRALDNEEPRFIAAMAAMTDRWLL